MTVVVICEGAKEKNGFLSRAFKKQSFGGEYRVFEDLTMVPLFIRFGAEELGKMSERRLLRMLRGAVKCAESRGGEITFSEVLCGIIQKRPSLETCFGRYISNKRGCFYKEIPKIVRRLASQCGVDLMRSVICIRDKKASRISEYLIRELCFDTKRILLCTEELETAEELRAAFAAETGMYVSVAGMQSEASAAADVFIDADEMKIRLGGEAFNCNSVFGFSET